MAPGALTPLPYAAPKTGLESKFSLPYSLAAGLVDERYTIRTYTDDAANRPEIARVLEKIKVFEDPVCVAHEPDYQNRSYGSRGTVLLDALTVDGRSASAEVRIAPGHPSRPLGWDDMATKFEDCAAYAGLRPDPTKQAFDMLRNLHSRPSIEQLLALLRRDDA